MSDLFQRLWQELALPPGASRPPITEQEVECLMRDRVSLVDGQTGRVVHALGLVILTSHRIIWHSREEARALQAHLGQVAHVRKSRNFFKSSSRVHVFLHDAPASHAAAVKLDFLHGGAKDRDDFLEQMKHLLGLRQWERVPLPPTTGPAAQQQQPGPGAEAPAFTTRTAGVGGIMRRQEHARAAQDRLATEAFADLSTLMDKAREVVGLIERYALVLASKKAENPGGGEGGEEGTKEGKELDNLLREMGMTPMVANPVTRELAGASMYHEELARQLAGFLGRGKGQGADLLKGRGGMLTLHDAFCLFNRARGTALISPEDLLEACNLLEPLRLGMRLRRFPSGVSVIEAEDFSDARVGERLAALVAEEQDGSLTALEVAGLMHVSITLAQEFLKTAEEGGHLCRDESIHGLLFYPNRFPEFAGTLGKGKDVGP